MISFVFRYILLSSSPRELYRVYNLQYIICTIQALLFDPCLGIPIQASPVSCHLLILPPPLPPSLPPLLPPSLAHTPC